MTSEHTDYSKSQYHSSGRYLWRTVLHRAQLEAEGKHLLVTTPGDSKEKIQRRARRWITTDTYGLRMVWLACEFERGRYWKFLEGNRERHSSKID